MTRPIPFLGIAGVSIKATLSSHNHGSKNGCIWKVTTISWCGNFHSIPSISKAQCSTIFWPRPCQKGSSASESLLGSTESNGWSCGKKNAPRQWTKCPTMFHRFFPHAFQPRSSKSCAKFLCSLKKSLNSKRIASVSWLTASQLDLSIRRWKPPSFWGPGPVESCGRACCICASAHLHCPHLPW